MQLHHRSGVARHQSQQQRALSSGLRRAARRRCRCAAQQQQQQQQHSALVLAGEDGEREVALSRRAAVLSAVLAVPLAASSGPAAAWAAEGESGIAVTVAEPLPPPTGLAFEDDDYQYTAPPGFAYIDIPIPRAERGPQPERSPMRSRFVAPSNSQEALGGRAKAPQAPPAEASVTVIVRNAQGLGLSLLQVSDISAYGSPEEAAKVLLPRGSTLLRTAVDVEELPPRETPLGTVDIPPKNYYLYEFETPQREHIAMVAAAQRGKIYVCGGATPREKWPQYGPQLLDTVRSFRLKDLGK